MDHGTRCRAQFGPFEADLTSAEIFKSGRKVSVQDKPFRILSLLLQKPGQLVSREEIFAKVWPGVFVQKNLVLNTAIRRLRVALEDLDSPPKLIETVGSRGYRLLVEVRFLDGKESANNSTPSRPVRLAVVPFTNLNGHSGDYFSDGLTEQMIAQLGHLYTDVKVIAPISSMHFKGDVPQLAAELRANFVLSGSVLRNSHRLRITAKLVRAADLSCVWSESYGRNQSDIFFVQEEITRNIARAIHRALPVPKTSQLHLTTTPATYEKYLKACFFANKFLAGFETALPLFEEVVAEDPEFALGHGALAITLMTMTQSGVLPPGLAYSRVKSEAGKALALCEEMAEPHTALGFAQHYYDADWSSAENSFRRALQLNPSFAMAYVGYSQLLTTSGRHDEAIAAAERARELDPLSPIVNTMLAIVLYAAGRFREALQWLDVAIKIEPGFSIGHCTLGWIHEAMGKLEDARKSYLAAVQHSPGAPVMLANLARGMAVTGDTPEANRLLSEVLQLRKSGYLSAYWVALIYAGLGQQEKALAWLETAVNERCGWRFYAAVDPRLRVLFADVKFERLLQEIGLSVPPDGSLPRTSARAHSPGV